MSHAPRSTHRSEILGDRRTLRLASRRLVATWLAVWTLITTVYLVAAPVLRVLPLPLRTLALTAVMVPTMTLVIMPWLNRRLGCWFTQPTQRLVSAHRCGTVAAR